MITTKWSIYNNYQRLVKASSEYVLRELSGDRSKRPVSCVQILRLNGDISAISGLCAKTKCIEQKNRYTEHQ